LNTTGLILSRAAVCYQATVTVTYIQY